MFINYNYQYILLLMHLVSRLCNLYHDKPQRFHIYITLCLKNKLIFFFKLGGRYKITKFLFLVEGVFCVLAALCLTSIKSFGSQNLIAIWFFRFSLSHFVEHRICVKFLLRKECLATEASRLSGTKVSKKTENEFKMDSGRDHRHHLTMTTSR